MKDIYITFSEALAALTPEQTKKFNTLRKPSMAVETQLAVIESITGVGSSVKESKGRVPKHNGRSENFVENNPFNEGRPGATNITEVAKVVAKRESMVESVKMKCNMSEAGARAFLGLKEKAPEGLNERQMTEYTFARRCGISESDAMTLAKMPLRTR